MKKGMIELIAPNDDRTKLYYYELKEKCYDLVSNFQTLDEKNKQQFELFSKLIPSDFSSECEFVFFQMAYSIHKPLLSSNTYGVPNGTTMYLTTSRKKPFSNKLSKNYFLSLASKNLFCVSKNNVEGSASTGFIYPDGSTISMMEQTNSGISPHQILARTLLHHYLMEKPLNSEMYLDYLEEYGKNINSECFFLMLANNLYPYAFDDFNTEFSEELLSELRPLQEQLKTHYPELIDVLYDVIQAEQRNSFQKMLKSKKYTI